MTATTLEGEVYSSWSPLYGLWCHAGDAKQSLPAQCQLHAYIRTVARCSC